MSLIDRLRKKKRAVYWEPTGHDRFGATTYEAPIQIQCYWIDMTERVMADEGEEITVRSTVFPDRVLVSGGVVWLGLLVDAPASPPEHYSIKTIQTLFPPRSTKTIWIVKV